MLRAKGASEVILDRMIRLYSGGITIPVVNNILGKPIKISSRTLRQGDCPSSNWFCYGIDPMLDYLEERLDGITIYSLPILRPSLPNDPYPLPAATMKYKVTGYCDDCKPAVTNMNEFRIIDRAASLFEASSRCRLHRDPASNKCKFLPLGHWKGTL